MGAGIPLPRWGIFGNLGNLLEMYMIAVQGLRGEPFLLNNVLVTNGEDVGTF